MNSEEDKNEKIPARGESLPVPASPAGGRQAGALGGKNQNVSLKFKITFAFCIVILISIFSFLAYMRTGSPYADGALDNFARCLTGKGATMYGAYWCPHCQNEKRAFGSSFRFVQYVECTEETARCLEAGIKGYPTWTFPVLLVSTESLDRQEVERFEGEQGLTKLSEISGCALP